MARVAMSTVFQHFPDYEHDLLRAIMQLPATAHQQGALPCDANGNPLTGCCTFFTQLVAQAAAKKTVVDLLARRGWGSRPAIRFRPCDRRSTPC